MAHYKQYFGMPRDPFNKDELTPQDAFRSKDFREVTGGLNDLLATKGIARITAGSGEGKTYAVHAFADEVNRNRYTPAYVCLSTVSVPEFYKELIRVTGAETKAGKSAMSAEVRQKISDEYAIHKRTFIIIIDEAQLLSQYILKELVLLTNFRYDSRYFFILILVGTPLLCDTLSKGIHEPLRQRLTYKYQFKGLDDDEVRAYVNHKLAIANVSSDIVAEDGMNALIGFCAGHGRSRVIDRIMSYALSLCAQVKAKEINAEIMVAAIAEYTTD